MQTEETEHSLVLRLITVPALLSLGVTLLRLAGELLHWSPSWFSTETGGVLLSGWTWVVGITWLPIPFGLYFAFRLVSLGRGPRSPWLPLGLAIAGIVIVLGSRFLWLLPLKFPAILIPVWLVMLLAGGIQLLGWPLLAKVLAAYGLAARVPVAIVMFLAMRGQWGTHYDYVGMPPQFQMSLLPRFLWLAFFPQLVFWVAFTVLLGCLAGSLIALGTRRRQPA